MWTGKTHLREMYEKWSKCKYCGKPMLENKRLSENNKCILGATCVTCFNFLSGIVANKRKINLI